MAAKKHTSIAEQLRNAGLEINNAMADVEIAKAMESSGYDRVKLAQGKTLLDSAKAAVEDNASSEAAQRETADAVKKAKAAANEAFQTLAQVAKGAFGREVLTSLSLSKPMPRETAAFLTAGYALFDNARFPEIQARLAPYGYDGQKLQSEREKISAYARADQAQKDAKEAARQTTGKLNKAMSDLKEWLSEFQNMAKEALREKKLLLEKVGVVLNPEPRCTANQAPLAGKVTEVPVIVTPFVTGPINTKS